jgi:hypothetical protein
VLRTGAYWRGPIGELVVVIRDERGRVATAHVEAQPAHRKSGAELRWHFHALEPRHAVHVGLPRRDKVSW